MSYSEIDITMTATLRPEIIRKTCSTFKQNFFHNYPVRLIINIDPVGPGTFEDVVKVVTEYFPTISICNPTTPHFPTAWKWVWSMATAPYVFHLEDDWECVRPVDLHDMIDLMDSDPDIGGLRLSSKASETDRLKSWNRFIDWNGSWFECADEQKVNYGTSGNPTLYKGEFIRRVVPYLDGLSNPEKQLRYTPITKAIIEQYRWGVLMEQNAPRQVADIGTRWRGEHGYHKAGGGKAHFTYWSKEPE